MQNQERLLTVDTTNTKVELLFAITEALLGVSEQSIRGKLRDKDIALARNIIGYIITVELGVTVKDTGKLINRDHATICYYTRNFDGNYKYYPDFRDQYTLVSETFWSNCLVAERYDIDLQVMSLQNLIDKLEERKRSLIKIH